MRWPLAINDMLSYANSLTVISNVEELRVTVVVSNPMNFSMEF